MSKINDVPAHCAELYRVLNHAIVAPESASFSLEDIASRDTWATLLRSETNHLLVGSSLVGALDALRVIELTAFDIERCPLTGGHGAVGLPDLELARMWLADGLRVHRTWERQQAVVTVNLTARGWQNNPVRITALILAIYIVATRAAAKAKHRSRGNHRDRVMKSPPISLFSWR